MLKVEFNGNFSTFRWLTYRLGADVCAHVHQYTCISAQYMLCIMKLVTRLCVCMLYVVYFLYTLSCL